MEKSLLTHFARNKELMRDIRALSKVSNLRATWAIARQWLVIAASIFLAVAFPHWSIWLLAALVIATRQHTLAILVHDATHYRLFSNQKVNDWVSDLCCALPISLSTELYRRQHLAHHNYLNTDNDPYWYTMNRDPEFNFPKAQIATTIIFMKDLVGLHMTKLIKWSMPWSPWAHFPRAKAPEFELRRVDKMRFLLHVSSLLLLLWATNAWMVYVLLWLLPSFTFLTAMVRMRGVAEHLVLENTHELNASRHVDGTFLERLTISPLNINCHIDHHLFASVPWFNLPKLHARLMREPLYQAHAHITPTYTGLRDGLLSEIVFKKKAQQPVLNAMAKKEHKKELTLH